MTPPNIFVKSSLNPSPVLTRPLMLGETQLIASNDEKLAKLNMSILAIIVEDCTV